MPLVDSSHATAGRLRIWLSRGTELASRSVVPLVDSSHATAGRLRIWLSRRTPATEPECRAAGRLEPRDGRAAQDLTVWNRRRRREFDTTKTDEKPIAAAAITGLSSPNAASGIAATL